MVIGYLVNGAGRLSAALLLPLIALVLIGIGARLLGFNEVVSWPVSLPVIGSGVTANTLIELQSFLFGIMFLFAGASALRRGEHVMVDMLSGTFSDRTRAVIDSLAILFLMLPFLAVAGWASIGFVERSWFAAETSHSGSLTHIFLFKAAIPVGLFLLALESLSRLCGNIVFLIKGEPVRHD